jgi:hypothetical protein
MFILEQNAGRHCKSHAPHCGTQITTEPVERVFYTCNTPIDARVPTQGQSATRFRLLAEDFPNSLERFEALIGREPGKESPGPA